MNKQNVVYTHTQHTQWTIMPCCALSLSCLTLPSEAPGKRMNTGVGSLSHLQGIFLTQELNPGLLHGRQILYQLSYQESPNGTLYNHTKEKNSDTYYNMNEP